MYLKSANYPKNLTDSLVHGFTHGFRLGHFGKPITNTVRQSHLTDNLKNKLLEKLNNEVTARRIRGPFDQPPFENFQISPITIRKKSTTGKFRLLHNLSYPYDGTSINDNIIDHYKSVKYANVNQAIKLMSRMQRCSYSAKSDIKDAFRLIPIQEKDHSKLGIFCNGKYYYDTTLPMGSASSCKIFESFSTALHHIMQHFMPNCKIIHYLDDFLFMAPTKALCQTYLDTFSKICKDIGIPLSVEKTTNPSTATTFLGIELDTVFQMAKLPLEKIFSYRATISNVIKNVLLLNESSSLS